MNSEIIKQPRPTEYRGVTFRSKSEAVFALAAEKSGFVWQYEPEFLTVGDWVPDFWLVDNCTNARGVCAILSFIVEFKPRAVTDAYLNELGIKFDTLVPITLGSVPTLITGSPFDPLVPRESLVKGYDAWGSCPAIIKRISRYWDESSKHRFDLKI